MHSRLEARTYFRPALLALAAIATWLAVAAPAALAVSTDLVVSQVYGGGGNTGAVYKHDFIELHNRGGSAVSVAGWSVQYAAAAGSSWSVTSLSGSIPAGGYYLVQEAQGAGGSTDLPAPDATGSIAMSATAGKVALVNTTTALSGTCPVDASIVDLVGYGAASCFETAAAPALSNTTAALRGRSGCAESDDNSADFATGAADPRNSASPLFSCRYTLDVAVVGSGSVGRSPDLAEYLDGTPVQLSAGATSGWHFAGWSGDASGSTNPLDLVMDADKSITATFAENTVVVSQVYGGGGNTGATLTHDFIELFNHGASAVNLAGCTVQYASATGSTWLTTELSGSIAPGGYFLVQQAEGAGGTTALPAPDATGTIAMNSASGKVALVVGTTPLSGNCPTGPAILDFVGYGDADCSETSPAPELSNTTAALRDAAGCEDTGDNAANFAAGGPAPRNSASPVNDCLFTLTVVADPVAGGSVSVSPDLPGYPAGTPVQITATFASGWHFDHWSGGVTGSTNPITVPMNGDMTVTAHFVSNAFAGGEIVISQVYGGGGNGAADYKHDYVELFNRGNEPVNVTGWTVQYASAGGGLWTTTTLIGTIDPGRYYLVQEAQGAAGTLDLPTPDAIGTSPVGASDGKVALVSDNVVLSGNCPTGGGIVDMVGYGTADCAETAPAGAPDNLSAAFRNNGGCDETDHNGLDFSVGAPTPRNSATSPNLCAIWLAVTPPPPAEFRLMSPTPNPTRGVSRIAFATPRESPVRLSVLDVQGRRIASLVDRVLPAGRHDVSWNGAASGAPVRPGLYFVRLEVPGHRFVTRLVIVR